ncbi:histidinol-phosphatase [Kribbella albertanoniae]|uniref:inositol-phosphate phosphatase n=1 Tax=Kribbella albertanoniae TaxID=1266829 RepID=A0A4R4Q683_9ACTN|nr:inositol monophosphatase [Kribbella albertanoniae]TDC30686.1 inositol monophosphatase [Kribbella albertanoniae]
MISERVRIARTIATAAAGTAASWQHRAGLKSRSKADGSVVTDADLATEEHVRKLLAEYCPGEHVVGEEFGGRSQDSADCWIVDPIDGTENFRRGSPFWGVLLAWQSTGAVAAAAVVAPAMGRNWWAGRGEGAFTDGDRRLEVSTIAELNESAFCFGGAHEYGHVEVQRLAAFAAGCRTAWGIGNFAGHLQVAEGISDGALSVDASIWDLAAPALIVAEAGGRWSDVAGKSDLHTGSLLSANPSIHPALLAGIGTALRPTTEEAARCGLSED